jgi:hypothetical protein
VDHDTAVEEDSEHRENLEIIDFEKLDFEDEEGIEEDVEDDN